jgi:hypothetical protein
MRPVLEVDPNTGAKIRSWIGPTSFVNLQRARARALRVL